MMGTGAHTIGISEQSEGAKMKSVLEMDNLSDFLIQAQLANKDFVSEREQFLNIELAAVKICHVQLAQNINFSILH